MAEPSLQAPATSNIAGYLGPENLNYVSRLTLDPRQRSAGMMLGDHKSPDTGSGLEFAVHRQYVTGDDVRQLDWNLYGRSDRLYIKKYEETTELRGVICLDLSGSMRFGGNAEESQPSKFEAGCKLAAALAYLLLRQGDAVSLVTYGSKFQQQLPPSSNPIQITRVLSLLAEARCETTTPGREDPPMSGLLHELAGRFQRREFFIVISDLMDDPQDLASCFAHFRHGRHEALLLHMMDPLEMDFPFRGWVKFQSLECGQKHLLESSGFRKAYLEALRLYRSQLQTAALFNGLDYQLCRTSRPWRELVFDALMKRHCGAQAAALSPSR